MVLVPLAAVAVSGWFATSLWRSWRVSHAPFLRSWAVAMGMYAAASAAVAAGALDGWSAPEFRIYWVLGAVLNVPALALGEVELLATDARVRRAALAITLAVAAVTVGVVTTAAMDPVALAEGLPSGKAVFGDGTMAHRLPQIIAIPSYLILVLGAAWSAWRMRGRPELRSRAAGTALVALGATVIAGFASAFAALGLLDAFSISLAVGVSIMFAGSRIASRRR